MHQEPGRLHSHRRPEWFDERFDRAASEIIEFFGTEFLSLAGREVADIGCGDGIIDLGVHRRTGPKRLVGFDREPVDRSLLSRLARERGHAPELPSGLDFRTSRAEELDADPASFDLAFSWSAFHLFDDPSQAIAEIHRVLRPGGVLMVRLYPFYHSPHGSLLEPWFPDGFAQLLHQPEEIAARVRCDPGTQPEWAEHLLESFAALNRLTLEELGGLLRGGGFRICRLNVIGEDARIPAELSDRPLWQLGVGGVKLLAVRA